MQSWHADPEEADDIDDESGPSSEGEEWGEEGREEEEEDALAKDLRENPQEWTALQPEKVRWDDRF